MNLAEPEKSGLNAPLSRAEEPDPESASDSAGQDTSQAGFRNWWLVAVGLAAPVLAVILVPGGWWQSLAGLPRPLLWGLGLLCACNVLLWRHWQTIARQATSRLQQVRWLNRGLVDEVDRLRKIERDLAGDFERILGGARMVVWRWETGSGAWQMGTLPSDVLTAGQSQVQTLEDFLGLLHPEDRKRVAGLLQQSSDTRAPLAPCEFRLLRQDGGIRWCKLQGTPLPCREIGQSICLSGLLVDDHDRRTALDRREQLQQEFADVSHRAGMAEIATGVLHNVGNVLNSINTSTTQLARKNRKSRLGTLPRASQLLNDHRANLGEFMQNDPRGTVLCDYLIQIGQIWEEETQYAETEIRSIQQHVEHVRQIIDIQQQFARRVDADGDVDLNRLVQDAFQAMERSLKGCEIRVVLELGELPVMIANRHSLLQIVYNLITNARQALSHPQVVHRERILRGATSVLPDGRLQLELTDNGIGFDGATASRLFQHGFSTRKGGHGFGLHSCALLARNMGGELTGSSPGPDLGATFRLVLPPDRPVPREVVPVTTVVDAYTPARLKMPVVTGDLPGILPQSTPQPG